MKNNMYVTRGKSVTSKCKIKVTFLPYQQLPKRYLLEQISEFAVTIFQTWNAPKDSKLILSGKTT